MVINVFAQSKVCFLWPHPVSQWRRCGCQLEHVSWTINVFQKEGIVLFCLSNVVSHLNPLCRSFGVFVCFSRSASSRHCHASAWNCYLWFQRGTRYANLICLRVWQCFVLCICVCTFCTACFISYFTSVSVHCRRTARGRGRTRNRRPWPCDHRKNGKQSVEWEFLTPNASAGNLHAKYDRTRNSCNFGHPPTRCEQPEKFHLQQQAHLCRSSTIEPCSRRIPEHHGSQDSDGVFHCGRDRLLDTGGDGWSHGCNSISCTRIHFNLTCFVLFCVCVCKWILLHRMHSSTVQRAFFEWWQQDWMVSGNANQSQIWPNPQWRNGSIQFAARSLCTVARWSFCQSTKHCHLLDAQRWQRMWIVSRDFHPEHNVTCTHAFFVSNGHTFISRVSWKMMTVMNVPLLGSENAVSAFVHRVIPAIADVYVKLTMWLVDFCAQFLSYKQWICNQMTT